MPEFPPPLMLWYGIHLFFFLLFCGSYLYHSIHETDSVSSLCIVKNVLLCTKIELEFKILLSYAYECLNYRLIPNHIRNHSHVEKMGLGQCFHNKGGEDKQHSLVPSSVPVYNFSLI